VKRQITLRHEFVEYLPTQLADATLYISVAYATAAHRCCCGCGNEVVTPLSPTDWKLIFDGETVTLEPSIGNWSFPCRSHYWINRNKVKWARAWSHDQIETNRQRDRIAKDLHFRRDVGAQPSELGQTQEEPAKLGLRRRAQKERKH